MSGEIDTVYAWVCTEPDGTQGIPATNVGPEIYPLLSSKRHVAEMMVPWAQAAADKSGNPIRLLQFNRTVELARREPAAPGTRKGN